MPEIEIYAVRWCADSNHARRHLDFLNVPYRYVDIDDDDAAERRVEFWNGGERVVPTIVLGAGGEESVLPNPSERELDEQLSVRGLLPIVPANAEASEP